ncbi:MAG TPA: arginase family protein [Pyrinomonadaceae bacterium]|nr:arginase family protein [Pyrinomonadaceae bacterium]
MDIFSFTTKTNIELDNPIDGNLGEIVIKEKYETAEIVILGCPPDVSTKQTGEKLQAPDKIRQEFYKFTDFGINRRIFDLGNLNPQPDLDSTFEVQNRIISQAITDRKKIIMLGGNLTYPNGKAMAQAFGEEWLATNVSSQFSKPLQQLLQDNSLKAEYFYEVGFQNHLNSKQDFFRLENLGVNLISFEQLRSQETVDVRPREMMREKFIHHTTTLSTMFSFDLHSVCAADAPGTNAPSPIGLRAGEFLKLVEFARSLVNTKVIEFTGIDLNSDIDSRTAQLVAIALHRICSN